MAVPPFPFSAEEPMPNALDFAFLTVVTMLATIFETFVFFPRFKAAVAAGEPDARLKGYRRAVAGQWIFTIICLGLWIRAGRSWTDLGLVPPSGLRMLVGIVLGGIVLALAVQQLRAIGRVTPKRADELRPKLQSLGFMLPHTESEYRWFTA